MKKLLPLIYLLLIFQYTFSQNAGNVIFNTPIVHSIYMNFSQTNYWDSLVAYYSIDKYLKGDIIFDGTTYTDVGIKFKGNSSYNNPSQKKSFKVDMNEFTSTQKVDGLKKFNLNNGFKDPSFMREKLALDFCTEHGIAAPRCTYIKVYLNNVYWGLYMFVEEADTGTFLDQHFGNSEGNMFKGDPSGDLKWLGSSPSLYYNKYELKTNETINDWSDLVHLIDKINNSGTNFYDSLETVLNTSSFIKNWAVDNLFVNLDSYIGSGHNYFIYHDTLSDKFEWVSWDNNEAFGNFKMNLTATQLKNLSLFYVSNQTGRPLVAKMAQNTTYKNIMATTVCQWLQYDFSNAGLDHKIDSLYNLIKADVYADTKKTYSNQQFDDNIHTDLTVNKPGGGTETIFGIKPFITARRNSLAAELATYNCTVGIDEKQNISFKIYPNPTSNYLTIESLNKENSTVIITDILGKLVYSNTFNSQTFQIGVSHFNSGIYFININNSTYSRFEKIE